MAANRGSKHHAAKMTEATVREARRKYESASWLVIDGKRQPVTPGTLAKKYGVSRETMVALLSRRTWGHVQ
jgi:hypothetical protein